MIKKEDMCYYMGSCIKEIRKQLHFSLAKLADESGVSVSKISQLEMGKRIVLNDIDSILEVLDITDDEFMNQVKKRYDENYTGLEVMSVGNMITDTQSTLYQYMLYRVHDKWSSLFKDHAALNYIISQYDVVFAYYLLYFVMNLNDHIYSLSENEINLIKELRGIEDMRILNEVFKCLRVCMKVFENAETES